MFGDSGRCTSCCLNYPRNGLLASANRHSFVESNIFWQTYSILRCKGRYKKILVYITPYIAELSKFAKKYYFRQCITLPLTSPLTSSLHLQKGAPFVYTHFWGSGQIWAILCTKLLASNFWLVSWTAGPRESGPDPERGGFTKYT